MVLPKVQLPEKKLLTCDEFGLDSKSKCLDREHFKNFPHQVTYSYNSRGFRDQEWPEKLDNVIWCLGDSFTVGIGSPLQHTWSHMLQELTNKRTINVSLDGASNAWIKRQALQILEETSPDAMVIHWSYFHRSEDPTIGKTDSDRRLFVARELIDPVEQLGLFVKHVSDIELAKKNTVVIHSMIPDAIDSFINDPQCMIECWNSLAGDTWPDCPKTLTEFSQLPTYVVRELKKFAFYDRFSNYFNCCDSDEYQEFARTITGDNFIPMFNVVDYARDGHHYDRVTASKFVNEIISRLGK